MANNQNMQEAMLSAGVEAPAEIIEDGNFHRFGKKRNGWYFSTGQYGSFGFWGKVDSVSWVRGREGISDEEYMAIMDDIAMREAVRKWEEKDKAEAVKNKAREMWAEASPILDHEYLVKKQISPPENTVRQLGDKLLIKVSSDPQSNGIETLQTIDRSGKKLFLKGGRMKGKFSQIGEIVPWKPIHIVEGFATGCTILEKLPNCGCVFIAFTAGALKDVAQYVEATYPAAPIVICADNDFERRDGNIGIEKATEAAKAVMGSVLIPPFDSIGFPSGASDFNDYFMLGGKYSDVRTPDDHDTITLASMEITREELASARLTPRCIVENYLYADLNELAAAGGTGKTTLLIHESIIIALGGTLRGMKIVSPGWTLFVTAEDKRERLVARLREVMDSIFIDGKILTDDQYNLVLKQIRIWDMSSRVERMVRKRDGELFVSTLPQKIIQLCKQAKEIPAQIIFDPKISFGAGEDAVNTNEQELVHAARSIMAEVDCCVRYVHHTGKVNARDKSIDMYSGRGGSAGADGARMVTVLNTWDKEGGVKGVTLPPEMEFDGMPIMVISRPKCSYCPPSQPAHFIKRNRFNFNEFAIERELTKDEIKGMAESTDSHDKSIVLEFLRDAEENGDVFNKSEAIKELAMEKLLSRNRARVVVDLMLDDGDIETVKLSNGKSGNQPTIIKLSNSWG